MTERNRDIDEIRQRLGLAPLGLTDKLGPGAVFVVDLVTRDGGEVIRLPEVELQKRPTRHATRRVIVVQSRALCAKDKLLTVQVVPCSGSQQGAVLPWEYELPGEEPAFTKDRVVAYPALVQPVLKSRLLDYLGVLSAPALGELQARLQLLYGLGSPVNQTAQPALTLPPR